MPKERSGSTTGRALSLALFGKFNLFVAGVGGLLSFFSTEHSLAYLIAGGAAYAFFALRDLANPQTWRRARREVGDPRAQNELPEPSQLFDPALQRAARQLQTAQASLARERKAGGSAMTAYLDLALGSAGQLDASAARLINRGDELFRYLRTQDQDRVRGQLKELDSQIKRAQDQAAKDQYLAARAAREQQLETLEQLTAALDRLHANVARIVATAEGLPARVVHMRALDGQAVDAMSGDVGQELDRLNREVADFEETLKSDAVRVPG